MWDSIPVEVLFNVLCVYIILHFSAMNKFRNKNCIKIHK